MRISNTEFINFKERIKFSSEDKKFYSDQIEYLVNALTKKIDDHEIDTRVLKVRQAGSWRKGTIIKPTKDVPVDIDLIFFLDIEPEEMAKLQSVNSELLPLLKSVYPNKDDEDFWDNPKTAGLEFIESGLNVDIVPVGKTRHPDYVSQPDKNFKIYYTSPMGQLRFVSDRQGKNENYKTIVRLLKKWRDVQDVKLSSFAIELIVGFLDINEGVELDIYEALLRFFAFVGKKVLPILLFNSGQGTYTDTGSHVYIADPTHDSNNIMHAVSSAEWSAVRSKANHALESMIIAEEEETVGETINMYKEVFGGSFNINPIDE